MSPVTYLSLFITENCNLRCGYCFAAQREKAMIDPDLAKKAVDFFLEQAEDEAPLHLSFWGGEPFLNFNLIKELVPYAYTKAGKGRLNISIPTNVTLLDQEKLDFLIKNKIRISLSLDGRADSQNQRPLASGQGSFELVQQVLELIHQYYGTSLPPVRKTVTPANVQNLVDDSCYFLEQGFRSLSISPAMEEPWDSQSFQLFNQGQQRLGKIWLDYLESGDAFHINAWRDLWLLDKYSNQEQSLPANSGFFCGAGSSMLAVDIHGGIYPCHRMVFYSRRSKEQQLGSIQTGLDHDAMEVFRNPEASLIQGCQSCGMEKICSSICPANNYALSGNINQTGKQACDFYTASLKFLRDLDKAASGIASYNRYRSALLKSVYRRGSVSGFSRFFWKNFDINQKQGLEDRALSILDSLKSRTAFHE